MMLDNRTFAANLSTSSSQREKTLLCDILDSVNGSDEYVRYFALSYWTIHFNTVRWQSNNQTLIGLFDRLAQAGRSFRSLYSYVFVRINTTNFMVQNLKERKTTNLANTTITLLDSSLLKVTLQFLVVRSPQPKALFNSINFTFFLTNSSQPSVMYLNMTQRSLENLNNNGLDIYFTTVFERTKFCKSLS